jgi:hypothetical protein
VRKVWLDDQLGSIRRIRKTGAKLEANHGI